MRSVPAALGSRTTRLWLPFASGLVLVAGVVAFLIVYDVGGIRNTAKVDSPPVRDEPATVLAKPKKVPPAKAALGVMIRFLETAVPRRSLVESYELTAPELRQGMTLREWKTGTIPVVYYPVGKEEGAGDSPYRVEWSYGNEIMLRVLLRPAAGDKTRPQEFWVGAKLLGKGAAKRWRVFYFAPRWFPPRLDVQN